MGRYAELYAAEVQELCDVIWEAVQYIATFHGPWDTAQGEKMCQLLHSPAEKLVERVIQKTQAHMQETVYEVGGQELLDTMWEIAQCVATFQGPWDTAQREKMRPLIYGLAEKLVEKVIQKTQAHM